MPRSVTLVPHNARWAGQAQGLIADLHVAAPGLFVGLHHIGSTAVPGLAAKPVVDLLGEVTDLGGSMRRERGWRGWAGAGGERMASSGGAI